jgi:hypothetical protein
MNFSAELAQSLNSKFCHDISGTIAAIESCTELLDSSDKVIREKALQIVTVSSAKLRKTVKLYRYAFGYSSNDKISAKELKSLITQFVTITNENATCSFGSELEDLDHNLGKIISALVIMLIPCIKKAELVIKIHKNNLNIHATGKLHPLNNKKLSIILGNDNAHPLEVTNSVEYYLLYLLRRIDCKIEHEHSENLITFALNFQNLEEKYAIPY